MTPPGRPRKGPRIHFQLTDDEQAVRLRAVIAHLRMKQGEALEEAVEEWLIRQERAIERATQRQEEK